jgi:hypothetical protein
MRDHESRPHPVQSAILIGFEAIHRVPDDRLPIGDDLQLRLRHWYVARPHHAVGQVPGEIVRYLAFMTASSKDDVMIYVGRYSFFATGRIKSVATARRTNWPNRYGVDCQLDQGHAFDLRRSEDKSQSSVGQIIRGIMTPTPAILSLIRTHTCAETRHTASVSLSGAR